MLKTNKAFVSEVRNHLRAVNKDDNLSARFILSVAYTFIQYIINNRPQSIVFRDLSNFTYVPCIKMKRIKSYKCSVGEFKTCDKIMRSKEKLPDIFNANLGYIIESITNLDNSEEYNSLRSPKDFKNTKLRQYGDVLKYYYISDGYLYLLNTTSEIVNINALFLDPEAAKCLSDCEECDSCKSKLDNKFVCPEQFKSIVRDQTIQLIAGVNKAVSEDENPNLDNNEKSRTDV